MRKNIIFGLMLSSAIIFQITRSTPYILQLETIKSPTWSLKPEFLKKLATIFKADVFIESGTYFGGTTHNAIACFKEIHTIELASDIYIGAKQRFKNNPTVHTYLGDSAEVLKTILPSIKGKIVFWLDGHYSECGTAKGKENSPILAELKAIKNSGIKNAVILVDDIRQFQSFENTPINAVLMGYPNVKELRQAILDINSNYQFVLYGDTALAFLDQESVIPSRVVQACTISRLFEDGLYDLETVIEAEKIIAQATGEEKATLQFLYRQYQNSESRHKTGKHFRLWYGLTLLNEQNLGEAKRQFLKASSLGCKSEHIKPYLKM